MITIKNYVRAASLEEAYELNQKASNRIVGGMLFLKLGKGSVDTAIDLSDLGLEGIKETDEAFEIGAMTTLRELEKHQGLEKYSMGAVRNALEDIVGVQFRNLATVGGSLYGRFGFSDVLTVFMAMDAQVELYKAGKVALRDFAQMKYDRDIVVKLIIKKTPGAFIYEAIRLERTDIPALNMACGVVDGQIRMAVGARPGRAILLTWPELLTAPESLNAPVVPEPLLTESEQQTEPKSLLNVETIKVFSDYAAKIVPTGSNVRGSAAYRTHLVKVLAERNLTKLGGLL